MRKFYIIIIAIVALAACRKEEVGGGTDTPVVDEKNIVITKDGATDYLIAYSSTDFDNAKQLSAAFSGELSTTITGQAASGTKAAKLILLGDTGKEESNSLKKQLGTTGYGIKVSGNKIVIVGTDAGSTGRALLFFQDSILRNKSYVSGKTFKLPKDYSHIAKDIEPMTFSEVLKKGYTYTVETKLIGSCPEQGSCYVSQGAASDGTYVWFVMRNSSDTEAVICKYTLNPFKAVGVGPVFNGGHCNDLTYDTISHKVVLAHGQSQGEIVTLIDEDSLKALVDKDIPVGAGAITFNPSRKQYAASQGGSTLHYMSPSFAKLKSLSRTDGMKSTYTAQGMGSDDDYIYFPMSPMSGKSTDNILVTYTWEGTYVGNIHIDLNMESESMFCVNGKYYVNFYNSRSAKLYQIIPSLKYKYVKK